MLNQRLYLLILGILCYTQVLQANVMFRFSFDIQIGARGNQVEAGKGRNKIDATQNSQVGDMDNNTNNDKYNRNVVEPVVDQATVGYNSMAHLQQGQTRLNEVASEKLKSSCTVISQLNNELMPLVGRSDAVASQVKLLTHYLANADPKQAEQTELNKFELLRKFVNLVDILKTPKPEAGGERSMEYLLLKLLLDKYGVLQLQREVQEHVLQAEDTWQRYVKDKLVEVVV